ncbi:MAG: efflux RND transporter periplasmic adaptor subunit [Methylotenera sp.]|nr:efflux RND transporter periplasmic adaptor subunit [Methylotenera sp.]MDP1753974.1 efflux RND transporter periplasmic adaptor subunit [Methylotenera sp.]MDP1960341.1 efflux RND transporter periplasmic adaptor subunit [Methylotenera sp.]MDP3206818.1 efflux RND transporter periplasmic adaptor subunit [Methylotenera sp.]MDP3302815.1 efflux RND transporter periplasmic adaptor subunit [Methylotenera sp.]
MDVKTSKQQPQQSQVQVLDTKVAKMALSSMLVSVTLMACIMLTGCDKKPDLAQAGGQMPAMPVSVITLAPTTVPISAEAVAQTEGAKEVEIRPRVGGILLKKLFEEGSAIKVGQAMFLIDPVPFQIALSSAKAQLAQQKARVEQTQREAVRLQSLLVTQSISQREADNAASDNALARATLAQFEASVREAELNLSYTTVTSPLSGIAGRFEFSEGALVNANTSLLTKVSQISPIWVRFSLSDNELSQIGGYLSLTKVKEVQLILPNGEEYSKRGQLNFAASGIDPALGTQQLRATFDNADKRLLPGQFVRVRVITGQKEGVFVVPQTAVMTNDQGKFVYVANDKNEASIKPIVAGNWVGKDWVVLSGLEAGDKVIVDNLIKIRPGAIVSPHPVGEMPAPASAIPNQSAN